MVPRTRAISVVVRDRNFLDGEGFCFTRDDELLIVVYVVFEAFEIIIAKAEPVMLALR